MTKIKTQENRGKIIIYKTAKNEVKLDVRLEKETIWLDAHQMSKIFNVDRTVIVKHTINIYKSNELNRKLTCAKITQVAADGKMRQMNLYNLDVIISVGYRVNSQMATQFRIWATQILKQYIVQGYSINQKRLLKTQEKFKELKGVINFLQQKSKKELLKGQASEVLSLLSQYSKTLTLLEEYDKNKLKDNKGKKTKFILTYEQCTKIIIELKKVLITKKEASNLFANERDKSFEGIIKGLYQTFNKKELYSTLEDKAAHILYLIIKDHPFSDGNKRTAAFLFVYFLDKTNALYRKNGERKINDNALTTLALLIAESNPKEKETMIKIIKNLIND